MSASSSGKVFLSKVFIADHLPACGEKASGLLIF
jgi:hypothetical protein